MGKIFGHRGLPNIYRENSITSLNKAFEYCDYVETDVRITADNNIILFHDPDINGQFINQLSTEEILSQLIEVEKDELILSSRDQIKGKVNFEIKTNSLEKAQIDILFQKCSLFFLMKTLLLHLTGKPFKTSKNYLIAVMASYLIMKMRYLKQNLYQYMMNIYILWLREP